MPLAQMGRDAPLRLRWSLASGLLLVLAAKTGEAFVPFTSGPSNAAASLRSVARGQCVLDPRRGARAAPLLASRKAESVELEEDGEEEEGEGAQAAGSGQEELVEWVVSGSDGAMPLDVVLARRFPELSRRVCRKLLQADKVRVNGQVTRRFSKVGKGANVAVYVPVQRQGSVASLGFEMKPEKMDLEVLYEDEHLLVVNKPPGLAVQPCESQPSGTLLHGVLHHLMYNSSEGGEGSWDGAGVVQGITHRLDKGTSGVWMYAKTRACGSVLSKTFEERGVGKTYIVCSHGNPGPERLVEAPIFRKSSNKMAVATNEEERRKAKPARSSVHTLLSDGSMSLARVRILTGRTHQIRVHMASLGCPALGDDVYCTSEFASLNRQYRQMGLKRVLLHAFCVELLHPVTKAPLRLVAPLSKDMLATAKYIANLKEETNGKRKERKQGILDALAAGEDAW